MSENESIEFKPRRVRRSAEQIAELVFDIPHRSRSYEAYRGCFWLQKVAGFEPLNFDLLWPVLIRPPTASYRPSISHIGGDGMDVDAAPVSFDPENAQASFPCQ
jgi:hypothetical protein